MSDLQLETQNKEELQTTLVAMPHDLGPNKLKDFVGSVILEVVPDGSLISSVGPSSNNLGGVLGRGVGTGTGVRGISTSGPGVWGDGSTGVIGDGSGNNQTQGVLGRHSGTGPGVRGMGVPGVVGVCNATPGARGTVPARYFAGVLGASEAEAGVFGTGKYGGQFEGSSAQLSLIPGKTAGKPASGQHLKGELYMDSAASLFVCIAGGTPGTWVKVVTA